MASKPGSAQDARGQLAHHLERLKAEPGPEARAEAAREVAIGLRSGELSDVEHQLAFQILEMLIYDVEVAVRAAIASELHSSSALPETWARELACDVSEVSLPVLRYAEVLSDDDLMAIIEVAEVEKLQAISQREQVSQRISGALVEQGDQVTVSQLLDNQGADIGDRTLGRALSRFKDSETVHRGLLNRRLPARVLIALVSHASAELRRELFEGQQLPETVNDTMMALGEEAALNLILAGQQTADAADTVKTLVGFGKLTDRLLLRFLLESHFELFAHGLAERAGEAREQVQSQLESGNAFARSTLFRAAGIEERLFNVFNAALGAAQPYLQKGLPLDQTFQTQAIASIRSTYVGITGNSVAAVLAGLSKTTESSWSTAPQKF